VFSLFPAVIPVFVARGKFAPKLISGGEDSPRKASSPRYRDPILELGRGDSMLNPSYFELGLLRHAGVVITALKFIAALNTCGRAMKAACSADRSAAKY
jgi:hypothetical protein